MNILYNNSSKICNKIYNYIKFPEMDFPEFRNKYKNFVKVIKVLEIYSDIIVES